MEPDLCALWFSPTDGAVRTERLAESRSCRASPLAGGNAVRLDNVPSLPSHYKRFLDSVNDSALHGLPRPTLSPLPIAPRLLKDDHQISHLGLRLNCITGRGVKPLSLSPQFRGRTYAGNMNLRKVTSAIFTKPGSESRIPFRVESNTWSGTPYQ